MKPRNFEMLQTDTSNPTPLREFNPGLILMVLLLGGSMKLADPVGNSLYAPLFIRCALGMYFILEGNIILSDHDAFIRDIHGLQMLTAHSATLVGILLPYLEITAGILLVTGLWTILGAFLISVVLATFILALGIFPKQGTPFNKDIILLAASLSLLYSGAGAFSIDLFRKQS